MQEVKFQKEQSRAPKGVFFIIISEIAERFSFYGMSGILTIFLVAQFFNPAGDPSRQTLAEARSNELYHLFVTMAYLMPLLGAVLADWFFGKYKVILYVSLLYCVGHLCLALFDQDLHLFQFGMVLIALGAGGIKSNVSANLGDQFTKSNQHLMSKIYGWFYFAINIGSVLANLAIPVIYRYWGPKWAFGIPGIFMAISTLIFYFGRKKYKRVPPSGIKKDNFVVILFFMLQTWLSRSSRGISVLKLTEKRFSVAAVDGVMAVVRILQVLVFIPMFWALYFQSLSEWILQAQKLDLQFLNFSFLPGSIRHYTLLPAQVQAFNPFFLLFTIPFFTYFVYPKLEIMGIKCTPLRKIGAGLFFCMLSFVVIAILQEHVDQGEHPTVWWQIFSYILMTVSEVLVSVTFLEYAYTQSPPNLKSTMTAIWLLSFSAGNLLTAAVNGSIAKKGFFAFFTGARYYWLFTGFIGLFLVIYLFVSPFIKEKSYLAEH